MFGKDVNQATGGNVCTATSGDTCQRATPGSGPGEFEAPTFIAVDSSNGPSAGDVYVGDTRTHSVSKFNPSGALITSWGVNGPLTGFDGLNGIAVDESGNLFVLTGTDYWYEQNGTFHSEFGYPRETAPAGLAVDDEDNLYKSGGYYTTKFTDTGSYINDPVEGNNTSGLTIDPATNDLYVLEDGSYVNRFAFDCGQSCSPVETFGSGHLSGAKGLAVDPASSDVYVANTNEEDVAAFDDTLPEVTTESATNVGLQSATLNGYIDPAGRGDVTECGFEYGTTTSYGQGHTACFNSAEEEVGTAAHPITSGTVVHSSLSSIKNGTNYHYRLIASNAAGPNGGRDSVLTTLPAVDGVCTEPASSVERFEATLHGCFTGNGEDTHYYYEWGLESTYGHTTPVEDAGLITGDKDETAGISGLALETTYHYRFVAENHNGVTYGPDQTFTTLGAVESLSTGSVTSLTATSATLNGSWTGDGTDTHCYFEWGTEESYGNSTSNPPGTDSGSGTGPQNTSAMLSGLDARTTYHYRVVCSNPTGNTKGTDQSVTTLALPVVKSTVPTEFETTGVMLNALVDPENGGETTAHFEYLSQEEYKAAQPDPWSAATSTPVSPPIGSDSKEHAVQAKVSGLDPGSIYVYRVVASSPAGTANGPDETFSTLPTPATIAGTSFSKVTPTSAVLSAVVNPDFGATVYRFQYGPTISYGKQTTLSESIGEDGISHPISGTLSGLEPATTYHFRAVAINLAGTVDGPDLSFTTPDLPTIVEANSTSVTETTATLTAFIKPGFRPTTYQFGYGPRAQNYFLLPATLLPETDNSAHFVRVVVAGLSAGTTYYFSVTARNEIGLAEGNPQAFTTEPSPRVEIKIKTPPGCKRRFHRRKRVCMRIHRPSRRKGAGGGGVG